MEEAARRAASAGVARHSQRTSLVIALPAQNQWPTSACPAASPRRRRLCAAHSRFHSAVRVRVRLAGPRRCRARHRPQRAGLHAVHSAAPPRRRRRPRCTWAWPTPRKSSSARWRRRAAARLTVAASERPPGAGGRRGALGARGGGSHVVLTAASGLYQEWQTRGVPPVPRSRPSRRAPTSASPPLNTSAAARPDDGRDTDDPRANRGATSATTASS